MPDDIADELTHITTEVIDVSDAPSIAPRAPLTPDEVRTILVSLMLTMFLAALDQTIVATALPTIGRELQNVADLPWVVTAYLVAATAATPLYGKFSDIHGRRVTILVAIATFIVGSLMCALASSMIVLIVARAVQGLGGGGLISLAQTAIADVTSPKERGRYQAYFAAVFASSSLAGPIAGGVIAEHLHWTVIFWINLPLGLAAYVMTSRTLKLLPRHERWHRLDVLGAVLITAAIVTLMLALSWGGNRFAWGSVEILGLVAGSVVLWALFGLRMATAEEPLIPLTVLRNQVVRTGTASSCFGMGTLVGLTVFLPVFFEEVLGLTAGESGLALIPLTVGVVIGATFAGRGLSRVTHYKRVPLAGLVLAAGGCLVLAFFTRDMSLLAIDSVLALVSVGMGTMLPITTVAVQNAVEPHELGTTTAAIGFFRQLGGALLVAVFGAMVLGAQALPAAGQDAAALLAGRGDLVARFGWMFGAAAIAFGLSFVLLLLMEERPLRGRASPAE